MTLGDLDQVIELDERSFEQAGFLSQAPLRALPELSFVMLHRNKIAGFILGRGGKDWISAGPWVVEGPVEHPENLLGAIAQEAGERPIGIGNPGEPPACLRAGAIAGFHSACG